MNFFRKLFKSTPPALEKAGFTFTIKDVERLEELASASGSGSVKEMVKRALMTYESIVDMQADGHSFYYIDKHGISGEAIVYTGAKVENVSPKRPTLTVIDGGKL